MIKLTSERIEEIKNAIEDTDISDIEYSYEFSIGDCDEDFEGLYQFNNQYWYLKKVDSFYTITNFVNWKNYSYEYEKYIYEFVAKQDNNNGLWIYVYEWEKLDLLDYEEIE